MKPKRPILGALTEYRHWPLFFFVVLPVLMVRVKFIPVSPDAAAFWPLPHFGDSRSWWKASCVIGIGAWMTALAFCRFQTGWRPVWRTFGVLIVVAMLSTTASALLSDFPGTAWLGYTSLYEGGLVLLAYLAAIWYAAEMTESPEMRRKLLRLTGCIGAIEAIHGIFEGFGVSLWPTSFGRWLVGAGGYEGAFAFSGRDMAYGTVFQPNHYGMLMAMLTTLALGMAHAEKARSWKTFWSLVFVAGMAAIVFSNSRTAMAVGCLLFVVDMILVCVALRRNGGWGGRRTYIFALCAMLAFLLLGVVSAGKFGSAIGKLANRITGTFVAAPACGITSVTLRDNTIQLVAASGDVWALRRDGRMKWRFGPERGHAEKLHFRGSGKGWANADLPGVENGSLGVNRTGGVILRVDAAELHYFDIDERVYAVDHKGNLYAEQPVSPAVALGGLEKYLGGRGQTWGKSLSLFWERPWLGGGPGSFALVFPNHDIFMKQRYLDNVDEDKGHSILVTSLVQLGMVGTLAYLSIIAYVALKKPWRHGPLGIPLTLGAAGYLLCSLTNDSTVGVTPIFCVLTGLALSQTRGVD